MPNFLLEALTRNGVAPQANNAKYVGLAAAQKCDCQAQGLTVHICRHPFNPNPGRMICDCCQR